MATNGSIPSSSYGLYYYHYHKRLMPFVAVVFLRFGMAGMAIIGKFALNRGMSPYSFVVYRQAVAAVVFAPFAIFLERKVRPNMTWAIFGKIALLALLEPVIDQLCFFMGMRYTSATFSTAMCNILPASTFLLAWFLRQEKVSLRTLRGQAKVIGTIVTVGGAMLMTLIKGPMLPSLTKAIHTQPATANASSSPTQHRPVQGALMIASGCVCWACFFILQASTLKSYPAPLSLTSLICLVGAMEAAVVAVVAERGNADIWCIHFDIKLVAIVYSGIICSGLAYYIQGIVMKERGPVFVTAFSPLTLVIVAISSSILLGEKMFLGGVMGAVVIVTGLYLVIWGKSKDHRISPSKLEGEDEEDKFSLPQQSVKQEITGSNNSEKKKNSSASVVPSSSTDEAV